MDAWSAGVSKLAWLPSFELKIRFKILKIKIKIFVNLPHKKGWTNELRKSD